MNDSTLHFAPNVPWPALLLLAAALAALGIWAYRFAIPPLPRLAKRLLPALRIAVLVLLAALLARPVLERPTGGAARLVVLVDRSHSMALPDGDGRTRAERADRAVDALRAAWRGRATVEVRPFAARLGAAADSAAPGPSATALGDALGRLASADDGARLSGVAVVSDGAVNAGEDPVAAARRLGVPVHTVLAGSAAASDRVVAEVEAPPVARVGDPISVRARVLTGEERGTPIGVRLLDGERELGRATVIAPGAGAEVMATFRVTPTRPGLAVWTAAADSLAGEATALNNARQVAIEVAPGRLGVTIVSGGLNWDLAFLRRALLADSTLRLTTLVRERDGWRAIESRRRVAAPNAAALRGQAVVVLDAIAPADAGLDAALAGWARAGGGMLLLGGGSPGLARFAQGALARELALPPSSGAALRSAPPAPAPGGTELLAWDDDAARGEQAWRAAAPLADVLALPAGAGDRVVLGSSAGPPLMMLRRVGRGQALMLNGTGVWRWSLSGADAASAERGARLWRRIVRALAEPVQAEPLRVRPERWLSAGGETVRLFATLQDAQFRPVAGATIEGQVVDARGRSRPVSFEPRAAGSYVASLDELPPGRYRVSARATRGGREAGRAGSEFAVDRWSFELARSRPDSAAMAAIANASGGAATDAARSAAWARALPARALARPPLESLRLWESPWLFALVVGMLSLEWFWRRRRGLP